MENSQQQNKYLTKFDKIFLAVLILGVVYVGINITQRLSNTEKPSSKTPKITRGSNVIIQSSGGNSIMLGVTKESYKEMRKYSQADDQTGLTNMILAETMFVVDSGTKALVIDMGVYEYEVRIKSGTHAGDSGWVASDLVKLEK